MIVAVAVLLVLGVAFAVQRKHEADLVGVLSPLCDARVDLAIANSSARPGGIGEYMGIISEIDPATRWVQFRWIEWRESVNALAPLPERLAEVGVIADDIRWVEPPGQTRIDLV